MLTQNYDEMGLSMPEAWNARAYGRAPRRKKAQHPLMNKTSTNTNLLGDAEERRKQARYTTSLFFDRYKMADASHDDVRAHMLSCLDAAMEKFKFGEQLALSPSKTRSPSSTDTINMRDFVLNADMRISLRRTIYHAQYTNADVCGGDNFVFASCV
jgi:hypothetical protein